MAKNTKHGFFKEMNRSEKAIEKRLKQEIFVASTEDLEDQIVVLKDEIVQLKLDLKEAHEAINTLRYGTPPSSQNVTVAGNSYSLQFGASATTDYGLELTMPSMPDLRRR